MALLKFSVAALYFCRVVDQPCCLQRVPLPQKTEHNNLLFSTQTSLFDIIELLCFRRRGRVREKKWGEGTGVILTKGGDAWPGISFATSIKLICQSHLVITRIFVTLPRILELPKISARCLFDACVCVSLRSASNCRTQPAAVLPSLCRRSARQDEEAFPFHAKPGTINHRMAAPRVLTPKTGAPSAKRTKVACECVTDWE